MIYHNEVKGYVKDDYGNINYYRYHCNSRDFAEKAILSLKNCYNCINCQQISNCSKGLNFDGSLYSRNEKVYFNENEADDLWISPNNYIFSKRQSGNKKTSFIKFLEGLK